MRTLVLIAVLAWSGAALAADIDAYKADLPNAALTPGEANPVLTQEKICGPGFRTGPFVMSLPLSSGGSMRLTVCEIMPAAAPVKKAVKLTMRSHWNWAEQTRSKICGLSHSAQSHGMRTSKTNWKTSFTNWFAREKSRWKKHSAKYLPTGLHHGEPGLAAKCRD